MGPDRLKEREVDEELGTGASRLDWLEFRQGWARASGNLIDESMVTVYLNGAELVSLMCTPRELDRLAVGFIANEGLIDSYNQVEIAYVSMAGCCVDVWLNNPVEIPERKIVTSGCGGGVTFRDEARAIQSVSYRTALDPQRLPELMDGLHQAESLRARAGGVHTAGLTDGQKLLATAEDVGRHNTVDKLRGFCLQQGVDTRGLILLVTGRISSEMLQKAASMGCPIIASRNSPTALAVQLAQAFNMTAIGYVRRRSLRVYTHPERLGYRPAEAP